MVVATYQSVSGAGKDGMDELDRQTKALYSLAGREEKKFPKRIAFNVIPQIDVFMEDGYTKEEWKMMVETKKILGPEDQADRHLRARSGFHRPFRSRQCRVREPDLRRGGPHVPASAPGMLVSISASRAATSRRTRRPARMPPMFRRIREDITVENGLSFWCVSDNLRKGAALNAVQIAEALVNRGLLPSKSAPPDSDASLA